MQYLKAKHGIICSMPYEQFGYFGWPTVARMPDGTLVVGSSGLRAGHICPWGKTVLFFSRNEGRTWSSPKVINDSPLDDRDCGIVSLGGKKLLATWFSTSYCIIPGRMTEITPDLEQWRRDWEEMYGVEALKDLDEICNPREVYENAVEKWQNAWCRLSQDGGNNWGDWIVTPVNAPHGPALLADGSLLYLGKYWNNGESQHSGVIEAYSSGNDGYSWQYRGTVPLPEDTTKYNFYEAHVVELTGGKLVGMLRYQHFKLANYPEVEKVRELNLSAREIELSCNPRYSELGLFQTESIDGGKTWSEAKYVENANGAPPHLMQHSSGVLICTYSYRSEPYGIRSMVSYDEGKNWQTNLILRDDGASRDLGYPSSVELADGSILTVYYQQLAKGEKCSLAYSLWELPVPVNHKENVRLSEHIMNPL